LLPGVCDVTLDEGAGHDGDLAETVELNRFLAAADLDELAAAYDDLPAAGDTKADTEAIVGELLASWVPSQGLANLLMYPLVIAPEWRLSAIERALGDSAHTYLRLAAVVGIEHLDSAELPDQVRHRLGQALLDLIRSKVDVTAERASITVMGLLRTPDAPEVVELLLHPTELVRQNLTQALFNLTGPSGLAALLNEPGFVEPDVQQRVREYLDTDGIELTLPADELRRPLILSYVPTFAEWPG
jgi:hypothetical protein